MQNLLGLSQAEVQLAHALASGAALGAAAAGAVIQVGAAPGVSQTYLSENRHRPAGGSGALGVEPSARRFSTSPYWGVLAVPTAG